MSHRNRVTYQSESVFVGDNDQPTPDLLTRVQNANYNFNITRTDVNQFGQVGRIDSLILEAPTVSLDLSYLLTDGKNEEHLDFVVKNAALGSASDVPFYKNILLGPNNGAPKRSPEGGDLPGDPMSGKSYYILTVPDGKDSISSDGNPYDPNVAGNSLIKIGNGYINEWSMEVSVGALPTVSCSFEAANCEVTNYIGDAGKFGALPAIDLVAFQRLTAYDDQDDTTYVSLPAQIKEDNNYDSEDQVSALRPGDIAISLSTDGGSVPVATITNNTIEGLTVTYDSGQIDVNGSVDGNGTLTIRFEGSTTYTTAGSGDTVNVDFWFEYDVVESSYEGQSLNGFAQSIATVLGDGNPPDRQSHGWIDFSGFSGLVTGGGSGSENYVTIDSAAEVMASAADIGGGDTLDSAIVFGNPITVDVTPVTSGGQPGVIAKQLIGAVGTTVEGAAHIQSFNLSIPFGRTPLQRIGTLFSFARPLDLPTNATFSVNALVSDLNDGKLMDKLCQKDLQIHIVMRAPVCPNLDSPTQGGEVIEIMLKDVELESESIGSSIGDNKTVDLTFNVGIHGSEDSDRGIFVRFHDAD